MNRPGRGTVWTVVFVAAALAVGAETGTVYFSATHEGGNLNEWNAPGGGVFVDTPVVASQEQSRGGRWSAKLDIPVPDAEHTSQKLFRWAFPAGRGVSAHGSMVEGYFSAWYWFGPSFGTTEHWHNIMQWMTGRSGGGNVVEFLQANTRNGLFQLSWFHWACVFKSHAQQQTCPSFAGYGGGNGGFYTQLDPIPLPREKWVHIEVYLRAARTNGHVRVWQDGVEIFHLADAAFNTLDATVLKNNTTISYACVDGTPEPCYDGVMWSINNYLDPVTPPGQLEYIDEARVTDYRVGPGSAPPTAPTNLRVK